MKSLSKQAVVLIDGSGTSCDPAESVYLLHAAQAILLAIDSCEKICVQSSGYDSASGSRITSSDVQRNVSRTASGKAKQAA
jgi:hypothetical protein